MSSFAQLLKQKLPQTWSDSFTRLFEMETQVTCALWKGGDPHHWIEGQWRVGDQTSQLWLGARREMVFQIAAQLTLMPEKRLQALLAQPEDPPVVLDAYSEWGNVAISYLADLFRQAFGSDASAKRTGTLVTRDWKPQGGHLDFVLSWGNMRPEPIRLVIA